MFGCIFKNFPKNIFWCLKKKKEKTNPEKHGQNPEKKSSTIDARLDSTARCFASSSPTTASSIAIDSVISQRGDRDLREIAIDGVISRSVDHDRREGEIVIDGTILRSVDCNLAKHRTDHDRREGEFAISDRDRRLVLANGAD